MWRSRGRSVGFKRVPDGFWNETTTAQNHQQFGIESPDGGNRIGVGILEERWEVVQRTGRDHPHADNGIDGQSHATAVGVNRDKPSRVRFLSRKDPGQVNDGHGSAPDDRHTSNRAWNPGERLDGQWAHRFYYMLERQRADSVQHAAYERQITVRQESSQSRVTHHDK